MVGKTCRVCGKPQAVFSMEKDAGVLPPGTELDGGSVIVGTRIGRGGFGITYRALDCETNTRVALKEFMPNHLVIRMADGKSVAVVEGNEDIYISSLKGFQREAKVLNELRRHPNIVRVLFTIAENNTVYYGMEYLDGDNLGEWAKKNYPKDLVPVREACRTLIPVMNALIYCHEKGVLHRDISPDNILLCKDKNGETVPKLIDFGAAYVAIQDYTHTFPNVRKAYFSPLEQMTGIAKDQGSWSDVYSFCATIYFLITGKPPVSSVDVAAGIARLQRPSELGARIPAEAEDVLMHGMTLGYKQRIQTIREFRDEFCRALGIKLEAEKKPVTHPAPSPAPHPVQPKEVTASGSSCDVQKDSQKEPDPKPITPDNIPGPDPEPAIQTKLKAGQLFARGILYLLLAACCYGFGFFLCEAEGLLYGWLAFALILIISLLTMRATPGMAAVGQHFVRRDGAAPGFGQFLVYSLLNASPLGLIDGIALLGGNEAISSRISRLKCVMDFQPEPEKELSVSEPSKPKELPAAPQKHEEPPSEPESSGNRTIAIMKGIDGPMKGRTLSICDGDVLGRNPQKSQVTVGCEDATVGRMHCRFVYAKSKGKWGIVNLSPNGIVINGKRITDQEGKPTVIPEDARIQIGKSTYAFNENQ